MRFIDIIFPNICLSCGEEISERRAFCSKCRRKVTLLIDEPLYGDQIEKIYNIFHYDGVTKELIHKIKFQRDIVSAYLLGREMGLILKKHRFKLGFYDYIVPIPTSKKRKKKRLYNQTEEMLKGVKSILNLPPIIKAERKFQQKSQVGLTKIERMENIKGAFTLKDKINLDGKNVLIFDDVYTTGATAEEMAKVLHQSGACRVDLLTCCRGKL